MRKWEYGMLDRTGIWITWIGQEQETIYKGETGGLEYGSGDQRRKFEIETVKAMNKLGDEGWELVNVLQKIESSDSNYWVMYFKREVKVDIISY